jgi:hypothetical protein
MRRTRIVSINSQIGGISLDSDPTSLPAEATAYTVERDRDGRATIIRPPAVTLLDEVVPGRPGACPECGAAPDDKPVREDKDKAHKLYRCGKCGTDFAVTDGV